MMKEQEIKQELEQAGENAPACVTGRFYFLCVPVNFYDLPEIQLLEEECGVEGSRLYLQMCFRAVMTNGAIPLVSSRYTPEHQIAVIMDADEELVEKVLTAGEDLGLIQLLGTEAVKVRDAYKWGIERSERTMQRKAAEDTEEGKAAKKNRQKKKEAEDLFLELWKLYPRKEGKQAVTDAAKKRLLKLGRERCIGAIETYRRKLAREHTEKKYTLMGSTFFNGRIEDYLDMPETTQQTTQTQAPTRESVKRQLEADGVISYAGVDRNRWNKVQDKYTDEAKAWAVKIMAENEI